MKIGILTFHRAINYGAVTQCYALASRLRNDFPDDDVEVIDYIPAFREATYHPSIFRYLFGAATLKNGILLNTKIILFKLFELIRYPWKLRDLRVRYNAFQQSLKDLPLSKTTYRQNDPECFRKRIAGQYDVLVVGSDCVWEWTTIPLPNAYFLPGDFGGTKVSFAASCGTDDPAGLSPKQRQFLKKALTDFSYVGVRDTATEYMVNAVTDRKLYHNCDPTTLLDPTELEEHRERVRMKLSEAGIDLNKPIVGLMCNDMLGKLARDIFGDQVQYVGIYVPNRHADVCFPDLSVLEWASIFGLFDLTFTTFFHGTMLSLVNGTPVLSFDYLPETERQKTKLHELYDRLNLPGFYHRGKRRYDAADVQEIGEIAKRFLQQPSTALIQEELQKEARYYETFKTHLEELKEKEKQ